MRNLSLFYIGFLLLHNGKADVVLYHCCDDYESPSLSHLQNYDLFFAGEYARLKYVLIKSSNLKIILGKILY